MCPAIDRPEASEERDESVERRDRIRLPENVRHLSERPARRQRIEQRLEQSSLRLELVVHRHPSDASSASDRIDREALDGVTLEEVAGSGENAVTTGIDALLTLDGRIAASRHASVAFVRPRV